MMNLPHLHLLVNHVPTVGNVIAVGLLLLSFVRKSEALRRASLEVFCVIALLTLPAYLSGVGTQLVLQDHPDVSVQLIDRHHDAAVLASIFMVLTGGFAWLALWQSRRVGRAGRATMATITLLSVVTVALMARTATLGGEVRHPEIVAEGAVEPGAPWITAASVAAFATEKTWVWPAAEVLHFIGLWLLFGVVLLINLRLLGMMRQLSFPGLHRLLPWAVLGLGMNIFTGMIFVLGAPTQYMENVSFHWKIGLLLLAGADLLYMTTFDDVWEVEPGRSAPFATRAIAVSAIAAWVGVMYFGRMLPFIGDAF